MSPTFISLEVILTSLPYLSIFEKGELLIPMIKSNLLQSDLCLQISSINSRTIDIVNTKSKGVIEVHGVTGPSCGTKLMTIIMRKYTFAAHLNYIKIERGRKDTGLYFVVLT